MTEGTNGNGDIEQCVNGICKEVKRSNGKAKSVLRSVLGLLTPVLVRSGDPRIVALGLALQAGSLAFLGKRKGGKTDG